ncbi:hypothetical protein [Rhodanobacter sp. BL-MT-08]
MVSGDPAGRTAAGFFAAFFLGVLTGAVAGVDALLLAAGIVMPGMLLLSIPGIELISIDDVLLAAAGACCAIAMLGKASVRASNSTDRDKYDGMTR